MVLQISKQLANNSILISSIGTDGVDGDTKYAGAMISNENIAPFEKYLKNNDSFSFFKNLAV